MRASWDNAPLGELCDILDYLRKPVTKKDRVSGAYPYYGATGILDYVDNYLFDEKLVLVGEDGAKWGPGDKTAFIVDGKVWVNNHAHVLRPHRKRLNDEWLAYYLTCTDLSPFVSGMTVPKLNQANLREIPVPLPPLDEQKRIVAILDEAFEGLDRAAANAKKNLANARELFDSRLNAIFTQKGPGWRQMPISELCEAIVDCPNRTAPTVAGPTPFKMIRTTNIRRGKLNLENVKFVDEDTYKRWTRRQVPCRGDVLLTREAPLGEVGMICLDDSVFLGQRIVSYRTNANILNNYFLLYALQSQDLQSQIRAFASGATVQHMRVPDTKALLLSFPTLEQQEMIVQLLDEMAENSLRLIALYEDKLRRITELRQSILQKAFAGELPERMDIAA